MEYVKVGIVGIGNIGSAHFNTVINGKVKGMCVSAVCDIDEKKLLRIREQNPDTAVFRNYAELCASSDIDAVIVAVPHPLHAKIAEEALKNGKHILVEKPVDITVSAAHRLNCAAKKSGKVFAVMFNQRTNGLYQKMREIVKSGELGELKRSVWIITNWYRTQSYYNSGIWRATWKGEGGGVLLNQAPHNLDLWQWICGMPVSVTAFCNTGKFHHIETEDEATVYVEFPNGATGVFITSTGDLPGTNRLEISGTGGKAVLENGKLKFRKLRQDERDICKNSKESFAIPETDYTEYECGSESGHIGVLQNFADAILYGEELIAPGYEGINELSISNAAYLSEWNGNKKISLPFDTVEFDLKLTEKAKMSSVKEVTADSSDAKYHKRWQVNW